MATKSIYKDIRIKDSKLASGFVRALERAETKQPAYVVVSKRVSEIKDPEIIKAIFK